MLIPGRSIEQRTNSKAMRRVRPIRRFLRKESVAGYLFISPWIIGFLLFFAYPLVDTFYNSFTKLGLFGSAQWIGFQNYTALFTKDPLFLQSCINMVIYVTLTTIIFIAGGFGLALILQRKFFGNHFFRIVFYLPSLMVGVAIGSMFVQVFAQQNYGLMNDALSLFHIPNVNWLGNYDHPIVGLFALIIVCFWFVGTNMLIFIAGLKGISKTYYEAARIDGASAFRVFRSVTLPLLTPVILFNTIMTLIGNIQVFDTALIFASGDSGNVGGIGGMSVLGYHNSLATFLTYLYQEGFIYHDYGYASALSVIIFLITLVLTALVLLAFKRFTYYAEN